MGAMAAPDERGQPFAFRVIGHYLRYKPAPEKYKGKISRMEKPASDNRIGKIGPNPALGKMASPNPASGKNDGPVPDQFHKYLHRL